MTSIRLFNYPIIIKNVITPHNYLMGSTYRRPSDMSDICRLIQGNFPIIGKKFTENEDSFEEYVTREIIALYYLFFILEVLENTSVSPVQQVLGLR